MLTGKREPCGPSEVLHSRGVSDMLRRLPVLFRDLLTAFVLLSAVGFVASERIAADSGRVQIVGEKAVTLRGVASGFPQPGRRGSSVVLRVLERWECPGRPDKFSGEENSGQSQPSRKLSGSSRGLPTLCKVLVRLKNLPEDVTPGDTLTVTGTLRNSSGPRNPGGFSEAAYLFQQGIWYVLEAPGFLRPVLRRADASKGFIGTYVAPLHRWIGKSVRERMSGEERAFLLALILGERGEFSEETKVAFRDSGLVHILSVSGLHTALVGLAAVILLKGVGFRERSALAGSVALVWFYCGLSGFQPPTVRAAFMLSWMIASRLLGRSTELFAPLCGSCAMLLLINPRYFWDSGFQLSYVATGSIIVSVRFARRVRRAVKMPEWVWKYVASTALTTCVAQLGVLPILALQFGSVSLVAVPANLLGIPLASGGLVCGFCSLIFAGLLPWAAGYAFDITWLLLRLCNLVASLAASMPCAGLELSRPHVFEVVAFLACFFVTLGLAGTAETRVSVRRKAIMFMTVSCTGLLLAGFVGVSPAGLFGRQAGEGKGRLMVDFLDVGQGDATVVRFPDGSSLLVDAGDAREEWDSGQKAVLPYMRAKGLRSIDAAIVSHFHSDHAGGFLSLIEKRKVRHVWSSGADTTSSFSKLVHRAAQEHGLPVEAAGSSGKEPSLDSHGIARVRGVSIQVLHPSGKATADTSSSSLNDSSLVCVIRCRRVQFILTGDAGAPILDLLAERIAMPNSGRGPLVTIVKAPHHGAAGTLSKCFVETIRPDYVVFSVGRRNRFGHPSREVIECYARAGARMFRTDVDGCVSFEVRGVGAEKDSSAEMRQDSLADPRVGSLVVSAADPGASHPFIWKARKWRAERALRVLTLLSFGRGRWHD